MKAVNSIIDSLENTPIILNNYLKQIPEPLYKAKRVEGKWCIHEQVCHLADAQKILMARFEKFEKEENPLIELYDPDPEELVDYMKLDMEAELIRFAEIRERMTTKLRSYDDNYWLLKGRHDCFEPYSTQILLTHCLNVDYAHMFSIEQLGLTKLEYESTILTIP